MRLIDVDALTKRLVEFCNKSCPYTAKARNVMCGSCFMGLALEAVEDAPTIEPDLKWIPCSEKLPEEDVEVLISYHYKDGEGDTSTSYIDITSYGQMYFGGNKVGNHKHWRAPFEYFESNYDVIAWQELPEPYRGEQK